MAKLKNALFVLGLFLTIFSYTAIANSLEITGGPTGYSDEAVLEERSNEESSAEEKAKETERQQ